jgi:uncharacterized membrane protein (DUF2068 family)
MMGRGESAHTRSFSAGDAGLRTIAAFEALKGLLVLAAGFGLLSLIHKNLETAAERLLHIVHVSPDSHLAQVFLRAAEHTGDRQLWLAAAAALAYSIVRFVEAYGLWNTRAWAEWFALISASLYLPWEVFEVIRHSGKYRWILLVTNIFIVLFMAYRRFGALYHGHRRPALPVAQ